MPYHEKPPKGYYAQQHPIYHQLVYRFGLKGSNNVSNSMIATFFRNSEARNAPEVITVNPANPTFAEETGPTVHPDSIVPRMKIQIIANMSKLAIETDKMRTIMFWWYPIYCAFPESLNAEDSKTAVKIEDIIRLTSNTGNKDVHPNFDGIDLASSVSNQPSNVIAPVENFGDYALTTDLKIEGVAFDDELLKDAMQYYSNQGMLKKVLGRWNKVIVTRDRPYVYRSNNWTHPSVKRSNDYMFCGALIHVPESNSTDQTFLSGDVSAIVHLDFKIMVSYGEWLQTFEQAKS